eukprot:jgi/Psemu1/110/gm1.110_g
MTTPAGIQSLFAPLMLTQDTSSRTSLMSHETSCALPSTPQGEQILIVEDAQTPSHLPS